MTPSGGLRALWRVPAGSLAEFELEVLSERVRAGMDRARRQGVHIGRPPVTARQGFAEKWATVRAELKTGRISRSEAAHRLGRGYATVLRLLEAEKLETSARVS